MSSLTVQNEITRGVSHKDDTAVVASTSTRGVSACVRKDDETRYNLALAKVCAEEQGGGGDEGDDDKEKENKDEQNKDQKEDMKVSMP